MGRTTTHYQVIVSGEAALSEAGKKLLVRAVKAALIDHRVMRAQIGLRLVSDEVMAGMNAEHLGHEGPTDVLTFDLREEGAEGGVEGEIAVSVDTARREAESLGHSVEAELALYAVHGVLHLLDYQDDTLDAASVMHQTEDRILELLGLGPVFASSRN